MNRLVIQRMSAISISLGITQPLKFRSGPSYLVGTSSSDFKMIAINTYLSTNDTQKPQPGRNHQHRAAPCVQGHRHTGSPEAGESHHNSQITTQKV